MAIISMFYGIIISMFYGDNKKHKKPHIHAACGDYEAVFSIPDGEQLTGEMPPKKVKLIQAWIYLHEDELMANWEMSISERNIYKIEPLR